MCVSACVRVRAHIHFTTHLTNDTNLTQKNIPGKLVKEESELVVEDVEIVAKSLQLIHDFFCRNGDISLTVLEPGQKRALRLAMEDSRVLRIYGA